MVKQRLGRVRATSDPRPNVRFATGFWHDISRIRQLIRTESIDVVLIGGLANPHGAIAGRLEGKPVVWQIVDSRTPRFLKTALMPVVRGLANAVMFNGEGLIPLHACQSDFNQPFLVYYPPVDTASFVPSIHSRQRTRELLAIPDDAPVVGMVANISPQKGIEYFVRAASIITRTIPDAYFVAVGAQYDTHKVYLQSIQTEIASSGVEPSHFISPGENSSVSEVYPAFDVKLITSVPGFEGTTTTALEAQACGIPVVATDVGAVAEAIHDGVTGFVVPPVTAPGHRRCLSTHPVRSRPAPSHVCRCSRAGRRPLRCRGLRANSHQGVRGRH